ncbi:MAG TPA: hypothetical protein VIP29_01855 [Nitrososphaeraceae archaeon]
MKFFKREREPAKSILFVCVENAGRSQMAEGFFNNKYAPKEYEAISAEQNQFHKLIPLQFRS